MRIGFVGLGNVGSKLAGSLVRNGMEVTVFDLDRAAVDRLAAAGAGVAESPASLAAGSEVLITCLPSPAATSAVMEEGGAADALPAGAVWVEMSTTDAGEVRCIAARLAGRGVQAADCPVSGGCHRAATANISVFAGCERAVFDRLLPMLTLIGRRVLHTGPLGTASTLKAMTNMLATANLIALTEALTVMKAAGLDLATTYEAIRISSGTSFVHETESQVILSGSRQIDFTMDLVLKDIGLFQEIAERNNVPFELSPMMIDLMRDGQTRYGDRAQSDRMIERLEEATGLDVTAPGFPAELVDDEPEERGYEVVP